MNTNITIALIISAITNWSGLLYDKREVGFVATNHVLRVEYAGATNEFVLLSVDSGRHVFRPEGYTTQVFNWLDWPDSLLITNEIQLNQLTIPLHDDHDREYWQRVVEGAMTNITITQMLTAPVVTQDTAPDPVAKTTNTESEWQLSEWQKGYLEGMLLGSLAHNLGESYQEATNRVIQGWKQLHKP